VEVPSTDIVFMKKTATDVDKIEIDGSYGKYTVTQTSDSNYVVEGLEDIEKDTELLSYMMTNASHVRAIRTIAEKAENIEDFGFSDNFSTNVTISYKDGESISLVIGGIDAIGGHTYVMVNGDETIYLFDSTEVSYYKRPIAYFVDKSVTESFESIDERPDFDKVVLKNKNIPNGVVIEPNPKYNPDADTITEKQYMLTYPKKAYLDDSNGGVFIKSIFGKTADEVVTVYPDDATLETYGLLNPQCELTYTYAGKEITLLVGNENEIGGYYVMVSDKDVVFSLAENFLRFKDLSYHDMITSTIITKLLPDVSKIEINVDDKDYIFNVSTDDEGNTTGTYNGTAIENILFRTFYQKILLLQGEYSTTDKPQGKPSATIKVTYQDQTYDVVELTEAEQRRVFITLNGNTDWKTRSIVIEELAAACENVINGKEIDVNW
ncbi:MAG: DUF4340 domain-containing protein, partial [Oscillospiraceae bacterium]|nr:DUF4340 domain-containing protein [Oscillospiraceae bacterium]